MKSSSLVPALALLCSAAIANAAEAGGHQVNGDATLVEVTTTDEKDFLKPLKLDEGFSARVWAAGAAVANIVAMDVDAHNRLYTAQTFRFRIKGVLDVREAMFLYRDDLRSRTTADRLAMMKKWTDQGMFKPGFFTKDSERVSLLQDTKGGGAADRIQIFADGFNDPLDGTASGILVGDSVAGKTTVYLAAIPKVWALTDSTGTGVADRRGAISEGYGPRFSISGHDLHGLVRGPDGRVYWSVGDRGYDVTTKEGAHFGDPTSGAVFRAEPDGSGVELYYTGLRNPEELAFNAYGDLFTCDNNADIGDKSRVVYILEGGSNGWSHGWQMLTSAAFSKAGLLDGPQPESWLDEGLWKTRFPGQPAWILPPIGYATAGPCGLATVPGTGWPAAMQGQFLVCDYRGGTGSAVLSFTPTVEGAGYGMAEAQTFLANTGATDVTFDYAGNLFVSDYLGGWAQADKGAILAVVPKRDAAQTAAVEAERKLVAEGFDKRPVAELAKLLAHADQRVRQFAQFELARRGKDGLAALSAVAKAPASGEPLARLHAIWGIGQIARADASAAAALMPLLADQDSHVREQAAKMLGDCRYPAAGSALVPLLADSDLRVRAFSAIALGRLKFAPAVPALLQLLATNNDQDACLRHAAVMGLAGAADGATLARYSGESAKATRLGVLLAMRRQSDAHIAAFLKDADNGIRAEAMRAIYDLPIVAAMPALIAELGKPLPAEQPEGAEKLLALRLINAAQRYGDDRAPAALAAFAAGDTAPAAIRAQALALLGKWAHPTTVDPVIGLYRPAPVHEHALDAAALKAPIMKIIAGGDKEMLTNAVTLAAQLGYGLDEKTLLGLLADGKMPASVRAEALRQLSAHPPADFAKRLDGLLDDPSAEMRIAAFDAKVAADPAQLVATVRRVLDDAAPAAPKEGITVVVDHTSDDWDDLAMRGPAAKGEADSDPAAGASPATWVDGFAKPHKDAGAIGATLPRLTSGQVARTDDDVERNTWCDGGESRFVLDLGKAQPVARVSTYSWHKANRAQQLFVLWGAGGASQPATTGDPAKAGWTQIAKVDSTPLGDGGKHGSAVQGGGKDGLGRYRWLMWQNLAHGGIGTFYSQLDVFTTSRTLPALAAGGDRAVIQLRQHALLALGTAKDAQAATLLGQWLDRIIAGNAPAQLALEVTEAAKVRSEPTLAAKLAQWQAALSAKDPLAPFRLTQAGGDVERGRTVFRQHAVQCIRCHAVDGEGGNVGPDLRGVPTRLVRDKLLESLIVPSAEIAPGYGIATVTLKDGSTIAGGVLTQSATTLVLRLPDGKERTVPMTTVTNVSAPISPMPPMGQALTRFELRDVLAYLYTLK